jgi:DNA-binding NarL/FixJ family response regulator
MIMSKVSESFQFKVLVVEDEEFTRTMVSQYLTMVGMTIKSVSSVKEALFVMDEFDPNVVVSDLDLGPGPDGADLLNRVDQERPWVGLVVLSSHASPTLAIPTGTRIPARAIYLVKSDMRATSELVEAIESSIKSVPMQHAHEESNGQSRLMISTAQGEILRLMAEGLSNAAIAQRRGVTLRAAESLVQRTIAALNISPNPDTNPRVLAVRMWQQGRVVIK